MVQVVKHLDSVGDFDSILRIPEIEEVIQGNGLVIGNDVLNLNAAFIPKASIILLDYEICASPTPSETSNLVG